MLSERIRAFASKERRHIAIGLDPNSTINPSDLEEASSICEVITIGRQIEGFEFIPTETPEEELVRQLLSGQVDGVIRGQLDHTQFVQPLLDKTGLQWNDLHLVSLLKLPLAEIWLAPVSYKYCHM